MNIVVLAGGLSPERQVSLVSGTGICRALRSKGHRAVLVDMYLGIPDYRGREQEAFDAPDGLCGEVSIQTEAPDLEAVRRSRADQSPRLFGPGVLEVYTAARYASFQMRSLADVDRLRQVADAQRKTGSRYVRDRVMNDVPGQSNGESAFLFFTRQMGEGGLYLLDEPENSLSPRLQLELRQFLEDSARFYRCQLIIATHSPFLLSLRGAKIYDLDGDKVEVRPWTQLPHVRAYYEFFREHEHEFTE